MDANWDGDYGSVFKAAAPLPQNPIQFYYCAGKIIAAAVAVAATVGVAATGVVCSIVQLFDRLFD